jgi:hypothetical protein
LSEALSDRTRVSAKGALIIDLNHTTEIKDLMPMTS